MLAHLAGVPAELDEVPAWAFGLDLGFGGQHRIPFRSSPLGWAPSCALIRAARVFDRFALVGILVRVTSQARMPSGSVVMSIVLGSIESIRHPSVNEAVISSRVTRCGPQSPGCWSLKHSMK